MNSVEHTVDRLMLLLRQEQERNIDLSNKLVDLIKERESLINEIERLKSGQVHSGH